MTDPHKRGKIFFIVLLGGAGILLTYYCHFILETDLVYTHFLYIPVILSGLWWGKKAIGLSLLLSANLWLSNYLSPLGRSFLDDLFRGMALIVVGLVVGIVVEKSTGFHRRAIEEKQLRIDQMRAHFEFVEKVAHELRNPLQVSVWALDSLENGNQDPEKEKLLDILNRNINRVIRKVKELTGEH